ncbi:MAG: hypothetical protein IJ328_02535 [Muribaculaceae bacterium]|nr:hypothetical protein [Muribaculaceae bacterium]
MKKLKELLLIIGIIISVSFSLRADGDDGLWKIHTVFNDDIMRVVDTGDKVYCLTDNYLNAYNKETGKFEPLTRLDRLSDYYVSNIYYNKSKDYLVVVYINSNIDILLADGITVNIPNLKNLTTVADKTINDVTFGEDGIYVASEIGYMVIDDSDFNVMKAAYWGTNVKSIAQVGDKFVLTDDSNVYITDKKNSIKLLGEMTPSSLGITGTIMPVNDNSFFLNSNLLYLVTISDDGTLSKTALSSSKVVDVQPVAEGFIALGGTSVKVTNKYYAFDKNGNKIVDISLPSALSKTLLTSMEKDGALWKLGSNGLQKVSLDAASSSVAFLSEEITPECVTAKRIGTIAYNKGNKRIYVTNGGPQCIYFDGTYSVNALISSYDGSSWRNEVPSDLNGYRFQDPYKPAFDNQYPNDFYIGTWFEGVYKIKDNKIDVKYDWNNSPMAHAINNWYCQVSYVQFDEAGNMWTVQSSSAARDKEIAVLPKEHLSKGSAVTVDDWIVPDIKTNMPRSYHFYLTSTGYKFLFDGNDLGPITVFTNDDKFQITESKQFKSFYDQEGKKMYWNLILDFEEDVNGIVWAAYPWGIIGINPEDVFKPDFRVIRPKSGENPSKYVLDNVFCTCISVDEYNRKWVGTLDDGVYLLDADCSKVLKHFNTSNSCMPNDKIRTICWNPSTQSVFMGFYGGLLEYKPENTDVYSNINITPSRVTPDFKGSVMFSGVPVNSTLFVKNSEGEVVRTIQAASSKEWWDCLDYNGIPVKTGVYYLSVRLNNQEQIHEKAAQLYIIE